VVQSHSLGIVLAVILAAHSYFGNLKSLFGWCLLWRLEVILVARGHFNSMKPLQWCEVTSAAKGYSQSKGL
jgi:hypothetical protein